MKLKEKLAHDFYRSKIGAEFIGMSWEEATVTSYLAGFHTALYEARLDTIKWLEITGVIPRGCSYYAELVNGLADVGKEEVD